MAILDDFLVMTESYHLPYVATHVRTYSAMANTLMSMARFKMGEAGEGIAITDAIDNPTGRFYKGFDGGGQRQDVPIHRRHFEEWANYQVPVTIAGTFLENNFGMTTRSLLQGNRSLSSFPRGIVDKTINYVGSRTYAAHRAGLGDCVRAMWGNLLASDTFDRMPVSLPTIFDETATLHGLGPAGLGVFKSGQDTWGASAPGQASLNVHVPRVFDNSGTPRTIAKDILQAAQDQMAGKITSGWWLGPTHPPLFTTLKTEFDAQIQVPMGVPQFVHRIGGVVLNRAIYFPDANAPTTRINHLHIGEDADDPEAGAFYCFWVPPEQEGLFEELEEQLAIDPNLTQFGGMPRIPYYSQEWSRDPDAADAISTALQKKYQLISTYRWKHFSVRDLQS